MNDAEVQSLLEYAGYLYNPETGQFRSEIPQVSEIHTLPHVADTLEIPQDDLTRWCREQEHAGQLHAD